MQLLDDAVYEEALHSIRQFVQSEIAVLVPDDADFEHAAALCERWQSGLRAGDALHITIAERRRMTICTLDRVMRDAALHRRIPVQGPDAPK